MDDETLNSGPVNYAPISVNDPAAVARSLGRNGWIRNDERLVNVEPAGVGNMNCTLRVTLRDQNNVDRTLILKQSRPWVERYPSIPAPVERSWFEARFYERVSSVPSIAKQMPKLVGKDLENYSLCLTDILNASDMTDAYGQATLPLSDAAGWLGRLHSIALQDDERASLQNLELRRLNHQHIFEIPFQEESPIDLDQITDGLEAVRKEVIAVDGLTSTAKELGDLYVEVDSWKSPNSRLLHGDYYPGSFLRRHVTGKPDDETFFVIDPEFSFVGPPEFDLGVLLAHVAFCRLDPLDGFDQLFENYNSTASIDEQRCKQFAGVEILRRLLGVAQLPLNADLKKKREWIEVARKWIG